MSIFAHNKFIFAVITFTLCALQTALADSPNVTAVLSNSEAQVGETVQLQIKLSGARGARAPEDIPVDGLEIHRTGTEQQIEMHNFNMSSSVIYTYTILPSHPGTFKIPPQNIEVGGKSLRTPELTLHVTDNAGGNASGTRPNPSRQQTPDARNVAFMELILPKQDAYVGEVIPFEIKIGLNSQVQAVADPDISDLNMQGITIQRTQRFERNLERRNGVDYRVWTIKAAFSAIRPGKMELPALSASIAALIPQKRPRPRDPFDEPFFQDPFQFFNRQPTQLSVHSEPATLDIRPLPPNAPANFSGAVGSFSMSVDAKPKTLQVGDPITVTATVSGRGNFDHINAPELENEHGWHKYPPSGKFVKDDDVGISGNKTFEIIISPNERKPSIPPLSFSYFDPSKDQYLTLRSEAVPIQVEGNPLANPQTAVAAAGPASTPPATGATPKPEDILYQLTDLGRIQSFAPIYTQPVFWLAQLVPLAGLLGLAGFKIRETKLDNREAQRIAAMHHESAELLRTLRKKDLSPQEYFGQASRAVQLKTALAKNVDPNTVDAETAAHAFSLDESSRQRLLQLFARKDELRYSGATNGEETISREARRDVLELIESLRV